MRCSARSVRPKSKSSQQTSSVRGLRAHSLLTPFLSDDGTSQAMTTRSPPTTMSGQSDRSDKHSTVSVEQAVQDNKPPLETTEDLDSPSQPEQDSLLAISKPQSRVSQTGIDLSSACELTPDSTNIHNHAETTLASPERARQGTKKSRKASLARPAKRRRISSESITSDSSPKNSSTELLPRASSKLDSIEPEQLDDGLPWPVHTDSGNDDKEDTIVASFVAKIESKTATLSSHSTQKSNGLKTYGNTSLPPAEAVSYLTREHGVTDSNSTESSAHGSNRGKQTGSSPTKRGAKNSASRGRGNHAGRGRGRGRWATGRDRDSPEPPPKNVMNPEERVLLNNLRARQSELKKFYNTLGAQQIELLEELNSRSLSRLLRKPDAHTDTVEYASIVDELEMRMHDTDALIRRRYDIEVATAKKNLEIQREILEVQLRHRIDQAKAEHLKGSQGDLVIFERSHRLAMDETRTDAGSDIASYPRYHELPEPDVEFVRGYTSSRVHDERSFQIRQANYDEQARRDVIDDEIVSPVRQADRNAAQRVEEIVRRAELMQHLVKAVGEELKDLQSRHSHVPVQDPDAPQFNLSRLADMSEQVARDPDLISRLRTSVLPAQRSTKPQLPFQPQLAIPSEVQRSLQSRLPSQVSMTSPSTDERPTSAYPDQDAKTSARHTLDGTTAARKKIASIRKPSKRKTVIKNSASRAPDVKEEVESTPSSNELTPLPTIAPAPSRPVLIQPAPAPQHSTTPNQQAYVTPSQPRPGPTTMAAILNPAPPSVTPPKPATLPRLETKSTFTMIHPQVHEHFLLPASSRPQRPPSPRSEDPGRSNPAITAFSIDHGPQSYHMPHTRHSFSNHSSQPQMLPPFQRRAPFSYDSPVQITNHTQAPTPFVAALPRLPLPQYIPADRSHLPANPISHFMLQPAPPPFARTEQGLPVSPVDVTSSKFGGAKSMLNPSPTATSQPNLQNHQSKFSVPGYGPPRTRALNARRGSGQITFTPTQTPTSSRFKSQSAISAPSVGANGFHGHSDDGHDEQQEIGYRPPPCPVAIAPLTEGYSSAPLPPGKVQAESGRCNETDANTLAGQNGRRLLLPKR